MPAPLPPPQIATSMLEVAQRQAAALGMPPPGTSTMGRRVGVGQSMGHPSRVGVGQSADDDRRLWAKYQMGLFLTPTEERRIEELRRQPGGPATTGLQPAQGGLEPAQPGLGLFGGLPEAPRLTPPTIPTWERDVPNAESYRPTPDWQGGGDPFADLPAQVVDTARRFVEERGLDPLEAIRLALGATSSRSQTPGAAASSAAPSAAPNRGPAAEPWEGENAPYYAGPYQDRPAAGSRPGAPPDEARWRDRFTELNQKRGTGEPLSEAEQREYNLLRGNIWTSINERSRAFSGDARQHPPGFEDDARWWQTVGNAQPYNVAPDLTPGNLRPVTGPDGKVIPGQYWDDRGNRVAIDPDTAKKTYNHYQDPRTGTFWFMDPQNPGAAPIQGPTFAPAAKVDVQFANGYAYLFKDGKLEGEPTFLGRDITTKNGSIGRIQPDGTFTWQYRDPGDTAEFTGYQEIGGRIWARKQDGTMVPAPAEMQPPPARLTFNNRLYAQTDPNDPASLKDITPKKAVDDPENWEMVPTTRAKDGVAWVNKLTREIEYAGGLAEAKRNIRYVKDEAGTEHRFDTDTGEYLGALEIPGQKKARGKPLQGADGLWYWYDEEKGFELVPNQPRKPQKAPEVKHLGGGFFDIPRGTGIGTRVLRKNEGPSGMPWAIDEYRDGTRREVASGAAWELGGYLSDDLVIPPDTFADFYRGVQSGQVNRPSYQEPAYGSYAEPWYEEEEDPWQSDFGYEYGQGQDVGASRRVGVGADAWGQTSTTPNVFAHGHESLADMGAHEQNVKNVFGLNPTPTAPATPTTPEPTPTAPTTPAAPATTPTTPTTLGAALGGTPTTPPLPSPSATLATSAPLTRPDFSALEQRGRQVAAGRTGPALTEEQEAAERQSPYDAQGNLNYQQLGFPVFGEAGAAQRYMDNALAENTGRWQSMVQRGVMTPQKYEAAVAQRRAQIQAEIDKSPELAAAGLPIIPGGQGGTPVPGMGDIWDAHGGRLRLYELPGGQRYLRPIIASGGYVMNGAGQIVADPREYTGSGFLADTSAPYGYAQQKTYRGQDGALYTVPSYAGPVDLRDQLLPGSVNDMSFKQYDERLGQWVDEASMAPRQISTGTGRPRSGTNALSPEQQAQDAAWQAQSAAGAQQAIDDYNRRTQDYFAMQMELAAQQRQQRAAGAGQDTDRARSVGVGEEGRYGGQVGQSDWGLPSEPSFAGDYFAHPGERLPWNLVGSGQGLRYLEDPELSYTYHLGVGADGSAPSFINRGNGATPSYGYGEDYLPPPGSVPPLDPSDVVGTGHKFGEPVSMEGEHAGVDLQATQGTPALAPVTGTVVDVKYEEEGLGLQVTVEGADGELHKLAHLLDTFVEVGDEVEAGEEIALVGSTGKGSTGPHLDYRIMDQGENVFRNPEPSLGPLAQMPRADQGGEPGMGMPPMGGRPPMMGMGQDWRVGVGEDWQDQGDGWWYDNDTGEWWEDLEWGNLSASSVEDEGGGYGQQDAMGRYPGDPGYGTQNDPSYYGGYGEEWEPEYLDPLPDWNPDPYQYGGGYQDIYNQYTSQYGDQYGGQPYYTPQAVAPGTASPSTGGTQQPPPNQQQRQYRAGDVDPNTGQVMTGWDAQQRNSDIAQLYKPPTSHDYPTARDSGASSRTLSGAGAYTGAPGQTGMDAEEARLAREQLDRTYQLARDRLDMEKSQFGETMSVRQREMELDNDYRTAQIQLGYAELAHREGVDTANIYLAIERNQLDRLKLDNDMAYQRERLDYDRMVHGDDLALRMEEMALETDYNDRRLGIEEERFGLERERMVFDMEQARIEGGLRVDEMALKRELAQMQMASEQARIGLDQQRLAVEQQRAATDAALGYARIGQDDRRLSAEQAWQNARLALETSQTESENAWRAIQADAERKRLELDTRRAEHDIQYDAERLALEREEAEKNRQNQIAISGTFEQKRQLELMDTALRNPWMQSLLGMAPGAMEPGGPGWAQLFQGNAIGQQLGGTPALTGAPAAAGAPVAAPAAAAAAPNAMPSFQDYANQSIFERAANRVKGEFAGTPWEGQAQQLREHWLNTGGPTTAPGVTQLQLAAGGPRAIINAQQIGNTFGKSDAELANDWQKNWSQAQAAQVQQLA